jgi:hypothetical protein
MLSMLHKYSERITALMILFLCVAFMLTLDACASTSAKQKVVVGLQASESALEASHTAERLLCAPTADQTKAIQVCDGPNAKTLGLTSEVHLKAAAMYSVAFDYQGKAAMAVKLWRSGDPAPSDLASYQAALNDLLTALGTVLPAQQPTISQLKTAISQAAEIAKTVGVK